MYYNFEEWDLENYFGGEIVVKVLNPTNIEIGACLVSRTFSRPLNISSKNYQ